MTEESETESVAELVKKQKVTRATIYARRARGWTEEEIQAGHRGKKRGKRVLKDYNSQYSQMLGGFTSKEVAKYNKISQSGLYYRLRNNIAFALPTKKGS